jgi:hypothetical protein
VTRIGFDAETGTDGTTCTAGNTGFDQVNVVGGTNAFEADAAIHGSMGYRIVTTSGSANQYIENFPASTGEVAVRFYFKVPSGTVTASSQLATVRNSGGNMAILVIDTSKRLVCQDSAGGDAMTPGSALPTAGTVVRGELRVVKGTTSGDGVRHFAYYLGDSTTAEYEATDSTSNTGTTNATNARLGRTGGSTWVTTIDLDDFTLDDAPAGVLIGPATQNANVTAVRATATAAAGIPTVSGGATNGTVVAVTATATALAEAPAVSAEVVIASSGPATATALASAPVVRGGASVTAARATSTAAAGTPVVAGGATVTAVRATATALATPPVVAATGSVTVTAVRATATASATSPVVTGGSSVSAVKAAATTVAYAPTATGGAVVSVVVATATTDAWAPLVEGRGSTPDVPAVRSLRITVPNRTLRILEAP